MDPLSCTSLRSRLALELGRQGMRLSFHQIESCSDFVGHVARYDRDELVFLLKREAAKKAKVRTG